MIKYFFAFSLLVSLNINCADIVNEKESDLREIIVQAPPSEAPALRQRNNLLGDDPMLAEIKDLRRDLKVGLYDVKDSIGHVYNPILDCIYKIGLIAYAATIFKLCKII